MFDIFIVVIVGCVLIWMLAATFFVLQLLIERFILKTLPVIVELYMRVRYPKEFLDVND
jgi:hypothetical protein